MGDRTRYLLIFLMGFVLPQEYLNIGLGGWAGIVTPPKLVALALVFYALFDYGARGRRMPPDSKTLWILAFAASVPVSAVAGILGGAPLRGAVGPCITWFSLFLFYFSTVYVIRDRRGMDLLMWGFAIGTCLAVVSAFLGFGVSSQTRFGHRGGGAGGNPNMLAFNVLLTLAIVGAFFFSSRRRMVRLFSAGAVTVCMAGLVISLSRSGFLGLVTMGGLFMVRTRRFQYAFPALAVALLFLVLVPDAWFDRIATISADPQDPSARNRLEMIPIIFHAFFTSPVVGVGLGRFVLFTFQHGYTVHNVIHNAYLEVLAEQGIVGFIPFMAIHAIAWTQFSRSWRRARRLRRYRDPELDALWVRALLLQIGFASSLVMGMFAPSHANKGLWMIFALSTTCWVLVRTRSAQLLAEAGETPVPAPRGAAAGLVPSAPAGPARA